MAAATARFSPTPYTPSLPFQNPSIRSWPPKLDGTDGYSYQRLPLILNLVQIIDDDIHAQEAAKRLQPGWVRSCRAKFENGNYSSINGSIDKDEKPALKCSDCSGVDHIRTKKAPPVPKKPFRVKRSYSESAVQRPRHNEKDCKKEKSVHVDSRESKDKGFRKLQEAEPKRLSAEARPLPQLEKFKCVVEPTSVPTKSAVSASDLIAEASETLGFETSSSNFNTSPDFLQPYETESVKTKGIHAKQVTNISKLKLGCEKDVNSSPGSSLDNIQDGKRVDTTLDGHYHKIPNEPLFATNKCGVGLVEDFRDQTENILIVEGRECISKFKCGIKSSYLDEIGEIKGSPKEKHDVAVKSCFDFSESHLPLSLLPDCAHGSLNIEEKLHETDNKNGVTSPRTDNVTSLKESEAFVVLFSGKEQQLSKVEQTTSAYDKTEDISLSVDDDEAFACSRKEDLPSLNDDKITVAQGELEGISPLEHVPLSAGSTSDLSVGSISGLSVGSTSDLSVGSTFDQSVNSSSDLRVGSTSDVSVGSTSDLSIGSTSNLSVDSTSNLSVGSTTDRKKYNDSVNSVNVRLPGEDRNIPECNVSGEGLERSSKVHDAVITLGKHSWPIKLNSFRSIAKSQSSREQTTFEQAKASEEVGSISAIRISARKVYGETIHEEGVNDTVGACGATEVENTDSILQLTQGKSGSVATFPISSRCETSLLPCNSNDKTKMLLCLEDGGNLGSKMGISTKFVCVRHLTVGPPRFKSVTNLNIASEKSAIELSTLERKYSVRDLREILEQRRLSVAPSQHRKKILYRHSLPLDPKKIGYLRYQILSHPLVSFDWTDFDGDQEYDKKEKDANSTKITPFAYIPTHIIAKIFSYLPTQDLAALKCVCYDFFVLINCFDIKGTDSTWSDKAVYFYDPCMYCGRIRDPVGDVSLCRRHPKGYYSYDPIGRRYWTCCLKPDRSSPGCQIGLHDNNWAFSTWIPSSIQQPWKSRAHFTQKEYDWSQIQHLNS